MNSRKGALGQRQWTQAFLKVAVVEEYATSVMALAMALSELHFNRRTGQCNPGYPALAEELGCSEKTIQRAAKDLEAMGWIKRHKPGHHENVEFTLTIPAPPEGTTAVRSQRAPEGTQNEVREDNCCPPFNEEHGTQGIRRPKIRSSPGMHLLAQSEAKSRAANERMRKRPPITAASSM